MRIGRDRSDLSTRRGAVAPWFVVTAPVLVLLAIMAVQSANLRHRQLELHTAAEAAALAAANALIDDSLLWDDADEQQAVESRARLAAARYAAFHYVAGRRVELQLNTSNLTDGELVIGTLENPHSRSFDAIEPARRDLTRPNRNTVRVAVRRQGVAASATAFVDRDVVGFKIQGSMSLPTREGHSTVPAIPLLPLAIPAAEWDRAIAPAAEGGEIRESTIQLSDQGRSRIVRIGTPDLAGAIRQLDSGVTAHDLAPPPYRGRFLLDDGVAEQQNYRRLEWFPLPPNERDNWKAALTGLCSNRPHVWMLYSDDERSGDSTIDVIGFAAVLIRSIEDNGDGFTVTFRPSMLNTATAVTDHARRDWGPRTLFNPTIGRVRMVE